MAKKTLGHLLLDRGLIDERQLNAALQEEKRWDNLARACRELQLVGEDDLVQAVSDFYKLPKVDLAVTRISPEAVRILDRAWCEEHECLAFEYQPQGKFLHVAMTNPTDATVFDKIRVATKCNVRPFVAGWDAIRNALDQTYRRRADSIEMQFALSEEDLQGLSEGEGKGEGEGEGKGEGEGEAAKGAGAPLTAEVRGELDDLRDRLDVMTDALERTERMLGFVVEQLSAKGVLPTPPKELTGAAADDDEAQFDLGALMSGPEAAPPEPEPQPPQQQQQPPPQPKPKPQPKPQPPIDPLKPPPATSDQHQPAVQVLPPVKTGEALLPNRLLKLKQEQEAAQKQEIQLPPVEAPNHEEDDGSIAFTVDLPPLVRQTPPKRKSGGLQAVDSGELPVVVEIPTGDLIDDAPEVGPMPTPAPSPATARSPAAEVRDVVAMDFGTTRSSVASVVNGKVSVLKLPGGERDMPSVVGFRRDGSVMLGLAARKMLGSEPEYVLASPKRVLGRRHQDPAILPYLSSIAMTSFSGPNGELMFKCRDRKFTTMEACAHVLHLLRLVAQKNLGREVKEAVLTTPVTFGEPQYAALNQAAELAGLEVVQFVDESAAAALANMGDPDFSGLVAIYDFGGGTFDFSVVDVSGTDLKVVATAGDTWLGGDDLDEALAKAAANAFWHEHAIELRKNAYQWQRLLVAAEAAKCQLSTMERTTLKLERAALSKGGQIALSFPVDRAKLGQLFDEAIKRSLETCRQAMDLSGIDLAELNAVYLSGGTCYVPAVKQAVAEFFGKQPRTAVPPERAVLVGAALYGSGLSRRIGIAAG
jgi:Hsp70 protein/MshEN domain